LKKIVISQNNSEKNGGVGLKLNMTFTAMEMLNLNIELLVRGKYIINVKSEMICMKSLDIKGEIFDFKTINKLLIGTKSVTWFDGDNYRIVADNDCDFELIISFA
jgi:hypothetical protein